MTPNEIKKALECCKSEHLGCGNCPLNEFGGNCGIVFRNGCDDLINQYEAEIESLKVEKLHLVEFLAESERNKAKAVQEFAERLKECFPQGDGNNKSPSIYWDDYCYIIDELAEKMVGEENG